MVAFHGVPFAEPPVRFQPPEEIADWSTWAPTYDAINPREACVSNKGSNDAQGGSEDCLYLDIYMPMKDTQPISKFNSLMNVMFWIHGGSWMEGSKNQFSLKFWATQKWNGDTFTVGVASNYRLNILGFPDFNGMHNGAKNLGTRDNIQALRFVNTHISDFSGDPEQVTIFGESAGSMQVIGLWINPDAKGFFKNAISQSPYVWSYENGQAAPELTRKEKMERMEECMDCAMNRSCQDMDDPECTYQTPTIENMTSCGCFGPWYGPVSDRGVTFPDDFYGHVCKESFEDNVPLLIGHNALEINFWTARGAFEIKRGQMKDWINHFGKQLDTECVFQKLGDRYGDTGLMQIPAQPEKMWMTENDLPNYSANDIYATSAVFFNMLSSNFMRSPNVYTYMFNESVAPWVNFNMPQLCAIPFGAHACEVHLVTTFLNIPVQKQTLQSNMRNTWKNFALSGEPGWQTDEIGIFTGDEIIHRDWAFDPTIHEMLHELMCEPDKIPECSARTCGDIKALYRNNKCCGLPQQRFDMNMNIAD